MSDKLLTVIEVSRYLNMHKITLYKMIHARKIPAFKIGGQWRFKRKMLDEWLAEGMSNNNKRVDNTEIDNSDLQKSKKEIKQNG